MIFSLLKLLNPHRLLNEISFIYERDSILRLMFLLVPINDNTNHPAYREFCTVKYVLCVSWEHSAQGQGNCSLSLAIASCYMRVTYCYVLFYSYTLHFRSIRVFIGPRDRTVTGNRKSDTHRHTCEHVRSVISDKFDTVVKISKHIGQKRLKSNFLSLRIVVWITARRTTLGKSRVVNKRNGRR